MRGDGGDGGGGGLGGLGRSRGGHQRGAGKVEGGGDLKIYFCCCVCLNQRVLLQQEQQ